MGAQTCHLASRCVVAWLALLLSALLQVPALAQNLESALRPGELVRSHAKWDDDCAACHVRFDRNAQSARCMDCHKPIGRDVRERTGMHGRMKPQPCRACHTDHKGREARIAEFDQRQFDHTLTDYALRGKHARVPCAKCHVSGRKYSEAPQECNACHARDDVHKGGLGTACADCHSESEWKGTRFEHDKTRFALSGKHVDVKCADCHRNHVYKDTPRNCLACHRKDDEAQRGHRGRFGERCESCHGARSWKPSSFNHDSDTRYALRGRHRSANCSACHTGTLYKDKLGSACIDCHAKDDRHKGELGRECQACHGERDWKELGRFDHDRSRFALLGRHREARCESCHQGGRYKGTETACVACHKKDDKHRPSLGDACQSCHGERTWKDVSRLDHDRTRFVLRGRHREATCGDCHKNADYRATPSDCAACHKKDDKHEGNLGVACGDCHAERDWKSAPRFDHQRTQFALRNAHAAPALNCRSCHADMRSYRRTPLACVACHKKDDKHEAQLGERCESCHDDVRWSTARFDHARSRFALVGRHLVLECKACHASPRYKDAPRDCDGCHRKDDKHALRFGTACESCHNVRGWRSWSFDHDRRTNFALDGGHRGLACERCHSAPAPKGRPIAELSGGCLACHRKDDKHDGAFGAACERCHNTANWRQISNRVGQTRSPGRPVAALLGAASWFARAAASRWPS